MTPIPIPGYQHDQTAESDIVGVERALGRLGQLPPRTYRRLIETKGDTDG